MLLENRLSLDDALFASANLRPLAQHISDVAAANLYLFRDVHRYRLVRDVVPHVLGRAYDGARLILPLVSLQSLARPRIASLLQSGGWLYPFTAERAQNLGDEWETSADTDDSDYVFRRNRLAELAGARDRRRQAEKFASHGKVRTIPLCGSEPAAMAAEVLDQWVSQSGKDAGQTDYSSCAEALLHLAPLHLFGLVALHDDRPAGFVIASAPWPDMAVIHFAKGLRSQPGVYPYLFSEFARLCGDHEWISFEQDLGNPRFRQAKRAFGPDHLITKYRARPRGGAAIGGANV